MKSLSRFAQRSRGRPRACAQIHGHRPAACAAGEPGAAGAHGLKARTARGVLAAGVALLLLASSGCIRHTTVSHWFGVLNPRAAAAAARQRAPQLAPDDDSLRRAFATQTQGAFNPATEDRQIKLLQTRLRLDPQDVAARLELAGVYERYRLYDEAFEHYMRALNLCFEGGAALTATPPNAAERAAAGLGRAARPLGQAAAVIPLLASFLKRAPGAAEVWDELGLLQEAAGDSASAEQAFRRAVAAQPLSSRLHDNLGYCLLAQNRLAEAESELRRAVQLDGHSSAARNNLGMTLAREGDLKGARLQFLAVSDAATAHNNLAVVLMEMGEYEQSRRELIKALAVRNYFAPAIENFKLVQQLLRERVDIATAGGMLPLSIVRLPALASGSVSFSQ
jgi:Flp pilus assembly protein TadD